MGERRYWISWYSALYPEPENIPFECWITGERGFEDEDDFAFIYVADIQAISESAAYEKVKNVFTDYEERFCNEVAQDWAPSDRFK